MNIMEEDVVIYNEGEVTQILINRPKHLNALNIDVLQSLILTFEKIEKNPNVKVVTIWGAGEKAFVAGADIAGMATLGKRAMADYIELGLRAMRSIETCKVPVIAAVGGFALGGGMELALACDIIVAGSKAKFGLPEVTLGIIPGFGGTQRLIQRCGIGTAKRLAIVGDMVTAENAHRMNLVDQVAEEGKLNEVVSEITDNITKRGPLAVTKAKQVINNYSENQLLGGIRKETEAFLKLFETFDREEGMNAFLEKRTAKFVGK
jgi:enoyl-CoA hydratase